MIISSWNDHTTTECLFGINTVNFLGHRLEEGLIGLHKDNLAKIRDAPRPTMKKQVRSLMGLAGYYQDFIPSFAALAAPLLTSCVKVN